jgi:hypothetical protein
MMSKPILDLDECQARGPQSELERNLLEEYLQSKGYRMADLRGMPEEEARALMKEACMYASLKLSELESRAKFRRDIRAPE